MITKLLIIFFGLLSLSGFNSHSPAVAERNEVSLAGEWVIMDQTTTPLSIIPFCKPVQKGTIFKFSKDSLAVYTDASEKPCDTFRYKIAAGNHSISFIKADMIWLCTYELQAANLKLNSENFFIPYESGVSTTQKIQLLLTKNQTNYK